MAITNMMGPSMRKKEANKGIIDWSIVTVGSGLRFEHLRGMPNEVSKSSPQNVPWGDRDEDVVRLGIDPAAIMELLDVSMDADIQSVVDASIATALNGFTGSIVVSGSVTLTVVNGLITTYA